MKYTFTLLTGAPIVHLNSCMQYLCQVNMNGGWPLIMVLAMCWRSIWLAGRRAFFVCSPIRSWDMSSIYVQHIIQTTWKKHLAYNFEKRLKGKSFLHFKANFSHMRMIHRQNIFCSNDMHTSYNHHEPESWQQVLWFLR